jgi:glycosyl transferase family 25
MSAHKNKVDIPVCVISLAESTGRRNRIENILSQLDIDFEFFDAIDGRAFDVLNHPLYDERKRLAQYGRHLNGGEIGCLLSHKAIYQKMVEDNIDKALILEDDVILRDDFVPVLQKILKLDIDYDAVRFLGSPKLERIKARHVCHIDGPYNLVRHTGLPGGTHATLMTKTGAEKMLKHLDKTAYPIDALMGRSWLTGLNWYTVRPGLAAQDLSFDSAIGDDRFLPDLDVTGISEILYPLTRGWFKLSENIGKKVWYYKNYLRDKKIKDKKYG